MQFLGLVPHKAHGGFLRTHAACIVGLQVAPPDIQSGPLMGVNLAGTNPYPRRLIALAQFPFVPRQETCLHNTEASSFDLIIFTDNIGLKSVTDSSQPVPSAPA